MPRFVRNFWIELEVAGKKTKITTGPRSSGGGFYMTINMRENGGISDKYMVIAGGISDGKLALYVTPFGVNIPGLKIETEP